MLTSIFLLRNLYDTSPICFNCVDSTWLVSCERKSVGWELSKTYISTVEHLRQEGSGHGILFEWSNSVPLEMFFRLSFEMFFHISFDMFVHLCSWCDMFLHDLRFLAAVLPRILLFWVVTLCCWVIPDIQSRKMFLDCLILNFDARFWTPPPNNTALKSERS